MASNVLCNLCGLSCSLHEPDFSEDGGLISESILGGYASTPGNGIGALDDCTKYTFSLCEFCLDFLFSMCKIPPKLSSYIADFGDEEPFRPAKIRVEEDEWRKQKESWYKIYQQHEDARINNPKFKSIIDNYYNLLNKKEERNA